MQGVFLEYLKNILPEWIKKQVRINELINATASNDIRQNPQILLTDVTKELFKIGLTGTESINEHYKSPGSTAESICSSGYFYQLLNLLSYENCRNQWFKILKDLKRKHYFDEFYTKNKKLLIAIDGWEGPRSNKKCCNDCLTVEHSNGTIEYYHRYVIATIVHPSKSIGILLDFEPSLKIDGHKKQDCEINQAKRLLERIHKQVDPLWDIVLLDALFCSHPTLNLIKSNYKKDYIIVFKNTRAYAYNEIIALLAFEKELASETKEELIVAKKTNGLVPYMHNLDHSIIAFAAKITNKKERTTKNWLWISSFDNQCLFTIIKTARRRWQGEEFYNLFEYQHHINHIQTHKKNAMKTVPFVLMICSSILQFFLLRKNKKKFTKKKVSPLKDYKYFLKYILLDISDKYFNSV